MKRILLSVLVVGACTRVGTGQETPPGEATATAPAVAPRPTPPPPPAPKTVPAAAATIELTAVTLADDCGGTPPHGKPARAIQPKREARADAAYGDEASSHRARAKRRCEQTSMQLTVVAPDASRLQIKSVELFDDAGRSLGTLTASKPTRWSDAGGLYEPWDEMLAGGSTTSVSYVLSQPAWDSIPDRWNRTFTLKTVVAIGGVDQAAEKSVTLSAPTSLPPNVRT